MDKSTQATSTDQTDTSSVVPRRFLVPFAMVTSLFALWGFANDVTNPMVRSFEDVFRLSATQSSLVQQAFYYGYAIMAIPAALVIRKTSFKTGIVVGLSLYAGGALLFWPASQIMQFNLFLLSFLIITFGLSFLETAANPYILSMGSQESATRRLNLAQAFNPMGSLAGMFVAGNLVLPFLWTNEFRGEQVEAHPEYKTMLPAEVEDRVQDSIDEYIDANPDAHKEHLSHDLGIIRLPYLVIGTVVAALLVAFIVSKMPDTGYTDAPLDLGSIFQSLLSFRYIGGVIAQAAYVGAQIACWTYIIHYGITQLGWTAQQSQNANICAMVIFLCFRWVWTYVLQFVNSGMLLGILAVGGLLFCCGAAWIQGVAGIVSLIATSSCMSAMFPTIYGIALKDLSVDKAKLASAGLIVSIAGGGLVPKIQSMVIDRPNISIAGIVDPVRASFLVPACCFIIVIVYGFGIYLQETKRPTRELRD